MNKDRQKEFSRRLSFKLGRIGIGFCEGVACFIPLSLLYHFTSALAAIGYRLAGRQRRIARESLAMAFGQEKSPQEIERIARRCFFSMVSTGVEFFMFMRHPERIRQYIQIEGLQYLDQALAQKKGVVALSGHFGSFPLLLSLLAMDGYKIHTVLRRMRDQNLDQFFEKKRNALGVGSIYTQPRQQCVKKSLQVLRDNEILFVQLDQNFGTGGVFVDFFGKKAATATGPIVFSMRTGAPIVPMFIVRLKGPRHKIVIEPPMEVGAEGTGEERLIGAVAQFTALIERYVRAYPHEWGWIHKRWKARPKEEEKGGGSHG
ncbi:MAG: lysophospholipid acyltransferase family protein [Candidatus Omnitrophota bacterium]